MLEPLKTSGLSFRELMTPIDAAGNGLTYLSSEIAYGFVRDLEVRNLVVPVVGNFSGPKALREVGSFIRSRGGMVRLFYVSNVETYLRRDGTWPIFCGSVRALPLDEWSLFIRPSGPSAPRAASASSDRVSGAVVFGSRALMELEMLQNSL